MDSDNLNMDIFTRNNNGKQVKCTICECWLPSADEKFTSSHINGWKHKQQLAKKTEKERALQCSVYVKGFNPVQFQLESELEKYFENIGVAVKDIYIDKNTASYGIIELNKKEDVDKILTYDRSLFHGKKLVIKPRDVSKKSSTPVPSEVDKSGDSISCLLPKNLEDTLNEKTDVVSQMKLFMDFFQLTQEEIELRNLICQLLENVLEEVYPECKVVLFGSSANGLGEKACDIDMTLILDKTNDDNDDEAFYTELREVIQRFAPGCKNVSTVQSAKTCTVVKFFHTQSNLFVDLSVNNYLAMNNTELLKTYMEYDPRVPRVMFTVRKWAKSFGLSGRTNTQITQYSLTLMVVYYLQQLLPPALPCLQECHPSQEDKIGQWDCSFCRDEKKAEDPGSKLTPCDELLLGFYKFYASFDFQENIIAVHSNSVISRNEVYASLNSLKVGDAEKDLKFCSPLVVQDPFKRSHNVTHNLSSDGLLSLVDSFKQAYSVLADANSSLTRLFMQTKKCTARPKQKRKKNRSSIYTISLPNCCHTCDTSDIKCYDYVKNILLEDLRMRICEENVTDKTAETSPTVVAEVENAQQVTSTSAETVDTERESAIVLEGLKRTLNEVDTENAIAKKVKVDSVEFVSFVATAYADTWTNRRKQRRFIEKLKENDTIVDVSPDTTNEDADSGITLMSDTSIPTSEASNLLMKAEKHVVLHFKVNIAIALDENGICKLKLEPLDESQSVHDFQTFYAYIKKELIAVFK